MGREGHRTGKQRMLEGSAGGETRRKPLQGNPAMLLSQLGFPHAFEAAWWGEGAGLLKGREKGESLRCSLDHRMCEALVKGDWPVVCRAWGHAQRGEVRELIALDAAYVPVGLTEAACRASRRVGRQQLETLLPLRDQRVVHRFWSALRTGEASGWHPVIYGLWLSVYAVPLRQGLMHYAEVVIRSWLKSASVEPLIEAGDVETSLESQLHSLRALLEGLLSRELPEALRFCSVGSFDSGH